MNKLGFFTPLMHKYEYEFIEKYLNADDILLEWGSGNSTLYFSGIVNTVISIEHDKDWIKNVENCIDSYDIKNITQYLIPAHTNLVDPCRFELFKDYIEFPRVNNLKFTKVLIDGRARKYCAKDIYNMIDDDVIVIIHDFNRPDYQMVVKYYDIIEQLTDGQGIAALKKKKEKIEDNNYY